MSGTSQEDPSRRRTLPWAVGNIYPVIPGRLSFTAHRNDEHTASEITRLPRLFFFSSDLQERYEPYCADFGPINLGATLRFCRLLEARLTDTRLVGRHLVYYTDENPPVFTNTCWLLGAFLVSSLQCAPEAAAERFTCIHPSPLLKFRDPTYSPNLFPLELVDCFRGLRRGLELRWANFRDFDVDDYEYWDDPRNGDLHMHCPKFVAFRGPSDRKKKLPSGAFTFTPKDYIQVFKDKGVTAVVRLNENDTYDMNEFIEGGINHYDLYFDDCTVPSVELIERFLDVCDKEVGAVAVHCKAGLGRTGTLIGIWMMKHYRLTAREAIGWQRIVRPGSVIGQQQRFLELCEVGQWSGNTLRLPTSDSAKDLFQLAGSQSLELSAQVSQALELRGSTDSKNSSVDFEAGGFVRLPSAAVRKGRCVSAE